MQIQENKSDYKIVETIFQRKEKIPQDWDFFPISKIGKVIGGGTPDTDNSEFWNGEILWAVPTDITGLEENTIEKTAKTITQEGLEHSAAKLLLPGTVIFTSRATIGECAINTKPIATNQGFQNVICNSNFHNWFIFYALQFHKFRLLRLAQGTTFLEISNRNIKKVEIPCPLDIEEQKAIASILKRVDSLIEQNREIVGQTKRSQEIKKGKNLQYLKKGLMQKLLTGQIRV